jgi:type II restriction/modification system DNA methylase subunit YeeA
MMLFKLANILDFLSIFTFHFIAKQKSFNLSRRVSIRKQYLSYALVQLPQNSNIVFLLWHKFITRIPIWFSLPISKLKKTMCYK